MMQKIYTDNVGDMIFFVNFTKPVESGKRLLKLLKNIIESI
jgi:hypothetical protein